MKNSSITCTRRLSFDAAHRVVQHESKCRYLHGHRYEIEACFAARQLDSLGRIIDFGVIKQKLGAWLDEHWDHTAILWQQDQPLGESIAHHTQQRIYYLPYNPTAENIARYLLETICPELFSGTEIECTSIVVHETPNCHARASFSDGCA